MAFRIIFLENESAIKIKLDNLIVTKGVDDIWVPLSDISMIVCDNLFTTLTTRTLTELAIHNIGLLVCDTSHLPIGFFSSYDNHSRVSKMIGFQINKDDSFCNNLWAEIVSNKIENQKAVLSKLNKNPVAIEKLKEYMMEIEPGDIHNREAMAAKVYFNCLMNASFSRGNEDILLNSGLDYGYSIIRSYIAKLCVSYGLNSQIGIHHKNEFNRFNLVDDLMEPIRPFVDLVAYNLLNDEDFFCQEHRHALVNLLNHKIVYRNKKMFFSNMLEEYIEQMSSFISERITQVVYPKIEGYVGECE